MIPLKLTIQGLYSYREPQTIDFETLTASQLFGIFGKVGSGKSSVLEAIVFVLYDQSERLNKSGDDRYYNMLNLQSHRLAIDFVFRVASPESDRYRFTVSAQRKKTDYEKVEVKERSYYRQEGDTWRPIEVTNPADIIGMTYDNFMQTVIIPQGKFREFIDRRPNERTQMLKELFRLEKFDLAHKANHLLAQVRSTITDLEARLSEIGTVTDEEIDSTRKKVYEYEKSLRQNADLLREAELACQFYEQLKKQLAERETAERELHHLQAQRAEYQVREQQLREYREAELYFNDRFERLEKLTGELNGLKQIHKQLLANIEQQAQQFVRAKSAWENAQRDYERRDTMRTQCRDLETLIRIHQKKILHIFELWNNSP